MGIRKPILFFHFFVFFICHHHLATESASTEPVTAYTKWIEQQINGTVTVCKDILGTKWKNDINIILSPNANQPFTVCVPERKAFPEFVDVNEDGTLKGGFSVAVFCLVLQELPFKIQPVFEVATKESKVVHKASNLVQKLKSKDCDVVVGDITITSNRTKSVDFTMPYMSSEIYMLVPAVRKWNQTMLTLVRPFTIRLWIAVITACIFIGAALGYLEYREKNPDFLNVPFYRKLFMIIWFPVSKIFFQEGRIHNRCSKVVLVIWLTTIFIVMQIFTACLSSWLTVNQLQPKVPKQYQVVGYQDGSFIMDFVNDHVQRSLKVDKVRGLPLSVLDDYKNVLDNGTVDAIFDELPYIDIFLAKYGDSYMKVGPLAGESGLGFLSQVFSRGSLLQQEFSRAVVKVNESPDMTEMKKKYFGVQIPGPTHETADSLPQSLDIHSFFLLFVFMGLATIIAVICSEITLMRTSAKISPEISIHIMSLVQTMSASSNQIAEN
ncbi:hypothetical protein SSX86_026287 [Deinandra increscens subsp. villosa]|uniref:Ionotropic glutamate receptor C-terminal domain-containing protein n=1 Tax=Deinandra increscens subsp. villosa TaxID=3103831 RepID=A0AAP0CJJ9_9ASTR